MADSNGRTSNLGGTGVWSQALRYGDRAAAFDAAAELESLGYSALWVPDVGGDLFISLENLLQATSSITIATGILNIWMREPAETAAHYSELTARHGERLLLGLGISHALLIEGSGVGTWDRPVSRMRDYLDALDGATTTASPMAPATVSPTAPATVSPTAPATVSQPAPTAIPATVPTTVPPHRRLLAALGPRMLELSRTRAAGAHTYLVTPEHTAIARRALGPDALLAPEQAVVLEEDPVRARGIARAHLAGYLILPNYSNNWKRLGFTDADVVGGGSDRLVDALVSWGDADTIAARVRQHRDAGADHVCVQVLGEDMNDTQMEDLRSLAPVLVG